MLARVPIRLRLALAFAAAMAVLLAVAGLFLRYSLAGNLDSSINQSLRARAGDVSALVAQADEGLSQSGQSPLTEAGQSFAQVLDPSGRVVDATPLLRGTPLIDAAERAGAAKGAILVERSSVPGIDERVRLLATTARGDEGDLVVVVGTSLEDRDDALSQLTTLLVIGGPVALLLVSAAGYILAAAALRPVESMRREAERISGGDPEDRLPIPPARDEIRRLGQTLNAMLARVQSALARERGFVSDASHELRTPLAILKTELELALRGDRPAPELRAALSSAGEETDRLARLADDLLAIARSDQGRMPVRAEPFAAAVALTRVRDRFAGRAETLGRKIQIEDGPPVAVHADVLRIEQAVGNLVENALIHGAGTVTLSAHQQDAGTELVVTDEGEGFPEDFAPRAFERFSRADSARARGGAGLGLAIVRAVARAHGGEAYVDNDGNGGGARATIVLPDRPLTDPGAPRAPAGAGRGA